MERFVHTKWPYRHNRVEATASRHVEFALDRTVVKVSVPNWLLRNRSELHIVREIGEEVLAAVREAQDG